MVDGGLIKTKCLILGGEGMLGHMLVDYFSLLPDFEVYFTSRGNKGIYFDALENLGKINEILDEISPHLVINCIGVINTSIGEDNKAATIFLNSYLPQRVAELCREKNSKLIHISTDCVFSGTEGGYTEQSKYSPVDFYGISKVAGEVSDNHNLTIRTSFIGPEEKEPKKSLMEWFFKQDGKEVKGYKNALWSGVTTLELAKKIVELYKKDTRGILVLASEPISKHDLLSLIKKIFNLNIIISPEEDFMCNRSMKSLRAGVYTSVPTHEEMLKDLKDWMNLKKVNKENESL